MDEPGRALNNDESTTVCLRRRRHYPKLSRADRQRLSAVAGNRQLIFSLQFGDLQGEILKMQGASIRFNPNGVNL